jgi:transposase InsO family protein
VGASTVARICRAAGLSRLRQLEAPAVPVRYEREKAGELLHVDIKRLGRFDRVGHRITRKRSFGSPKQGFEFVYVAIDDFTRLSYVDILADERSETASTFLKRAVDWFAMQKVNVERVMTDNGSAFLAGQFAKTCEALNVRHKRTRPYTPRTNGKAERFIQTLLREWAYRSPTAPRRSANAGSLLTCTSTTTIALTLPLRTIHRSVAWIGTTS